jgi:hypothetical protein
MPPELEKLECFDLVCRWDRFASKASQEGLDTLVASVAQHIHIAEDRAPRILEVHARFVFEHG